MRALLLPFVIVLASAGCKSGSLPMDALDMDIGNPDHGRGVAAECDLTAAGVPVGDLATARALLPGRWLNCSRPSDDLGPWTGIDFAGLEFVTDDSVTPAAAGGGRWFYLSPNRPDGPLERIPVPEAEGTFLYNPLPGPDFEQIALQKDAGSIDYQLFFTEGPRKLRMTNASFTAVFVLYGQ